MFDLAGIPSSVFTEPEIALIQTANPQDLTPEERGRRLQLLLRTFSAPSYQPGVLVTTSLMAEVPDSASGNGIINILRLVSLNQTNPNEGVFFGNFAAIWGFVVEYVRQLVARTTGANLISAMAGGGRGRRPFHTLDMILGGPPEAWMGISPSQTRLIAARLIELYTPDLLEVVPAAILRQLGIGEAESEEKETAEQRPPQRTRNAEVKIRPEEFRSAFEPETAPSPSVAPPSPPIAPPAPSPVPTPPATPQSERSISLAQRYRPCHLDQIFDQVRAVNQLRGIVRTGVVGARGSAVFLWGPPGTGKTTAATAFARDYFIKLGLLPAHTEGPCPDLPREAFTKITRNRLPQDPSLAATTLNAILGSTITSGALSNISGLKRVVLIDDFSDFPPSVVERLKPLLENYTGNAIVLITTNNDPAGTFTDRAGQALLSRSQIIHFTPIPSELVARRLHDIANAEGIVFPGLNEAINAATTASHGDLGLAIGGLQSAYNEFLGASGG